MRLCRKDGAEGFRGSCDPLPQNCNDFSMYTSYCLCVPSLRYCMMTSTMSCEISEFCKDHLIICILGTSVIDEVDVDCLELDKPDSELKPSEHDECPPATWVQSWKLKGLKWAPRNYKNSRYLIVYCVVHTSRDETKKWKCMEKIVTTRS